MRHYVISLISGCLGVPAVPVKFPCSVCISLFDHFPTRFYPFTQFFLTNYHLTTNHRHPSRSSTRLCCNFFVMKISIRLLITVYLGFFLHLYHDGVESPSLILDYTPTYLIEFAHPPPTCCVFPPPTLFMLISKPLVWNRSSQIFSFELTLSL